MIEQEGNLETVALNFRSETLINARWGSPVEIKGAEVGMVIPDPFDADLITYPGPPLAEAVSKLLLFVTLSNVYINMEKYFGDFPKREDVSGILGSVQKILRSEAHTIFRKHLENSMESFFTKVVLVGTPIELTEKKAKFEGTATHYLVKEPPTTQD